MSIYGTWYSETVEGSSSNDVIYGYPSSGYGSGYDDYDGYDTLYGYGGDDTLYGGNQDDALYGGDGYDILYGGLNPTYSGNDSLYGGANSDLLYGGAGYDYLNGYGYTSYEYDSLTGGSEADTFALGDSWGTHYAFEGGYSYYGDGYATVTDYNYWEGDTIQLNYNDYASGYYSSDSSYDYNGNGLADTSIYYGSNLIGVVSDTTYVAYNYV